jgi:hypothetical protein
MDGTTSANDPLFMNPIDLSTTTLPFVGGDYSLKPQSPAIDRGNDSYNTLATDLAGNPRRYATIDLGAYEFPCYPMGAENDAATTTAPNAVVIDVLANDYLNSCSTLLFDTVAGKGARHGSVVIIPAGNMLEYTPDAGHFGIDSLDYEIGCIDCKASARRVYIMTLASASEDYYACPSPSPYAMTKMSFVKIPEVTYDWYDDTGTNKIESLTDTLQRSATTATQTFFARPLWHGIEFLPATVRLHPSADEAPGISDIRLTLCPTTARDIYLTSYLDSLPYVSAVNWTTTGVSPAITDVATGALNTGAFPPRGTFTYTYTRDSKCATAQAVGKAYVHIPSGRIPHRNDTIAICRDQASAININSIFGFELDGVLKYDIHDPAHAISDNVASTPLGARYFDGAKAYDAVKTNPDYNVAYHGAVEKGFVFEYDYSSSNSIAGKKRIVIVVTN